MLEEAVSRGATVEVAADATRETVRARTKMERAPAVVADEVMQAQLPLPAVPAAGSNDLRPSPTC